MIIRNKKFKETLPTNTYVVKWSTLYNVVKACVGIKFRSFAST